MNNMLAAAAAASALLAVTPANAAVAFLFTPGGHSPSVGFQVIEDFDPGPAPGLITAGVVHVDYVIQSNNDSQGADNPFSDPQDTNYISVLGGHAVEIAFGPVSAFQFDWGSIDNWNRLTIRSSAGNVVVVPQGGPGAYGPGNPIPGFTPPGNGNQTAAATNGLFRVYGTAGETFTGFRMESAQNSFELDNIAVPVPEPATWAMMIAGFGGVGAMIRRRRSGFAVQTA